MKRDRSFAADSPIGSYWLGHCTGFWLRGGRRSGVIEEIGLDPEGRVESITVRRRGTMRRRAIVIPVDWLASVDPWNEEVVLARREDRTGRAVAPQLLPAPAAKPPVRASGPVAGLPGEPDGSPAASEAATVLAATAAVVGQPEVEPESAEDEPEPEELPVLPAAAAAVAELDEARTESPVEEPEPEELPVVLIAAAVVVEPEESPPEPPTEEVPVSVVEPDVEEPDPEELPAALAAAAVVELEQLPPPAPVEDLPPPVVERIPPPVPNERVLEVEPPLESPSQLEPLALPPVEEETAEAEPEPLAEPPALELVPSPEDEATVVEEEEEDEEEEEPEPEEPPALELVPADEEPAEVEPEEQPTVAAAVVLPPETDTEIVRDYPVADWILAAEAAEAAEQAPTVVARPEPAAPPEPAGPSLGERTAAGARALAAALAAAVAAVASFVRRTGSVVGPAVRTGTHAVARWAVAAALFLVKIVELASRGVVVAARAVAAAALRVAALARATVPVVQHALVVAAERLTAAVEVGSHWMKRLAAAGTNAGHAVVAFAYALAADASRFLRPRASRAARTASPEPAPSRPALPPREQPATSRMIAGEAAGAAAAGIGQMGRWASSQLDPARDAWGRWRAGRRWQEGRAEPVNAQRRPRRTDDLPPGVKLRSPPPPLESTVTQAGVHGD